MSKIRTAKIELYRQKGKIHPRAVTGHFNRLRWGMVWATQIVFYGTCWLNWDDRQAVLFDIAHEKFYLFGWVLWPQDALLLALLLIAAATALFFVTALAGRLFCGFVCPQTVYTAIFTWIEARIEGDHLARLRLDAEPYGPRKLALRAAKHAVWLLVSAWTSITFVAYFTPIDELLNSLAMAQTGPWESFWLIFYALFTYVQAGLARDAVCQHMCPYSRFQGVMIDEATHTVAYDFRRGEPRGARRSSPGAEGNGDCVDCNLCVEVCPTGIDIRSGLNYQCINCGLCVDACNEVMDRLGAPRSLIRFASEREFLGLAAPPLTRRPRLIAYGAILLIVLGSAIWMLSQRNLLLAYVQKDRSVLMRETGNGIENAYFLKLVNMSDELQALEITVSGMPGLQLVGQSMHAIPAGSIREIPLTLAVGNSEGISGRHRIHFDIRSTTQPELRIVEQSTFMLPQLAN